MSDNWVQDISDMHTKFDVNDKVRMLSPDLLEEYLKFRARFIREELDELDAAIEEKNSEEIVDALIDICVVAIGTLNAYDVNPYKAWDEVHQANMNKEVGIKASRPNPYGLPDLIKPKGWQGPDHTGNYGLIDNI